MVYTNWVLRAKEMKNFEKKSIIYKIIFKFEIQKNKCEVKKEFLILNYNGKDKFYK